MKKEKISRWILILVILILLPTALIWADGGYFSSQSIAVSADQRAILIKNGNEISMTLSTGYTGEGEDFGWLIPTPVPPATKDVSETGKNGEKAFEILDKYTAPVIETRVYKGCFPSGTEVLTARGIRVIETVEPGTEVYACDLSNSKWVLAKVLIRQSYQYEGDMVTIHMGQDTIQATGNHPFFVIRGDQLASRPLPQEIPEEEQVTNGRGRWVEARDLRVGDVLKAKVDESLIITDLSIQYVQTEVYNLSIDGYHNNAVHQKGILVHNKKAAGGGETESKPLVTVYGKVTTEHYDVSILGAADASALLNWLQKNGYQVNPEAGKVLNAYIEDNWAFVAVKLKPSEKRHYENEFLPPLTIRYHYDHLVYPLRISSVSTTKTVKITLYVIVENTVTSSNFPTATLLYKSNLDAEVDPEEYIVSCIQRTIPRDGRGLVLMWREKLIYERQSEITDKLIKTSFTTDQNVYMTRLESRMDPSAMTEDIRFALDSGPGEFAVYITSGAGSPVFIRAVQAGKTNTVQKMLQTGIDVNMKDDDGLTALMWAARLGHTNTVQLLLQKGASVNVQSEVRMETALMWAARKGQTEIVQLLLQAGSDVNMSDHYGKTALWYAKMRGNKEIKKLLRQAKRK